MWLELVGEEDGRQRGQDGTLGRDHIGPPGHAKGSGLHWE